MNKLSPNNNMNGKFISSSGYGMSNVNIYSNHTNNNNNNLNINNNNNLHNNNNQKDYVKNYYNYNLN